MAIICVDGNIGSGKSSVLEYLHTRYGCSVDLEPVRKWQPYLNELYASGKSAFEFQVRVWLDRCWIQMRPNQSNIIMERSPYFQSKVFVPTNYKEKRIGESEHKTLNEMYQMSMKMWSPEFYIYLRSNPTHCMERIQIRHREGEDLISQDYIQQLHDLHERAYMDAVVAGRSILCIDVEGKTIESIGDEVYQALKVMKMVS
jgi:thymidine kinase